MNSEYAPFYNRISSRCRRKKMPIFISLMLVIRSIELRHADKKPPHFYFFSASAAFQARRREEQAMPC